MNMHIRIFLLFFFIIYYGVLFVLNSYLAFRKNGKNPYVLGRSAGIIGFVERTIKTIGIIVPIVIVVSIASPTVYSLLLPIQYIENIWVAGAGMFFMLIGFAVCVVAQYYMKTSWRIGIAVDEKVSLVSTGIYGLSRNPFFVGTFLTYFGFFFVLPNIVSFTSGVLYYMLIQIQVRLEEENMAKSLGESYQQYCLKVGRWI